MAYIKKSSYNINKDLLIKLLKYLHPEYDGIREIMKDYPYFTREQLIRLFRANEYNERGEKI